MSATETMTSPSIIQPKQPIILQKSPKCFQKSTNVIFSAKLQQKSPATSTAAAAIDTAEEDGPPIVKRIKKEEVH